MHNLKIFSAIAIVAITALSSKAIGAVAIVGTGNALVLNDTSKDAVMGYSFTVGSDDILVTSLGLWDAGGDGFSVSHIVGLGPLDSFSSSVIIPSGADALLIGEFRFVNLSSPLLLERNTFHVISVTGFSGSLDGFRSSVPGTILPESSTDIVLGVSAYQHDIGLDFPLVLVGGTPHIGPSFQYTVIPEPSGSLFFAATFLVFLRRRRCKVR